MPKNTEMERTWILLQISSTILAKCFGFFYGCHSVVFLVYLENTFYIGE